MKDTGIYHPTIPSTVHPQLSPLNGLLSLWK